MYKLIYTKQARKDAKKLAHSGFKEQAIEIIDILRKNPFQNPPHLKNQQVIYQARIREE